MRTARHIADMSAPSIIYLCINLPRSEDRRQSIAQQAERIGIRIELVEAIAGADLPPVAPGYDSKARRRCYSQDLMINEQACVLSHIKALRTFVNSGADYGLIMEDDAMLADNFAAGLEELLHHWQGWEVAKLYNTPDIGKLYPVVDAPVAGAAVTPVFPKKLLWGAVGYLYTRRGAEKLLAGLQSFSLAADALIGATLLELRIPTIGITPAIMLTYDPNNEQSSIDPGKERVLKKPKRSLAQYIFYRLSVWKVTLGKWRMRRMMRRLLRHV